MHLLQASLFCAVKILFGCRKKYAPLQNDMYSWKKMYWYKPAYTTSFVQAHTVCLLAKTPIHTLERTRVQILEHSMPIEKIPEFQLTNFYLTLLAIV